MLTVEYPLSKLSIFKNTLKLIYRTCKMQNPNKRSGNKFVWSNKQPINIYFLQLAELKYKAQPYKFKHKSTGNEGFFLNMMNNQSRSRKHKPETNPDKVGKVKFEKDSDIPEEEEERCVICYEEFKNNQFIKRMSCKHLFHSFCIESWFTRSNLCPLCKAEIKVG